MNYFAHALPFLDDPYYAVGTAVPDMLMVVDRRARLRAKRVAPLLRADEGRTVSVAGGLLQHFRDDARFHETRAFAETSLALTVLVRDALEAESGFRPSFLGHLLVEVLLDASLIAEHPAELEQYFQRMASVDPRAVEAVVNRALPRPTDRLAPMIAGFSDERFLSDYLEDAKLMVRLGQIMRRVKLPPLPAEFQELLPQARSLVNRRRRELLDGIPTSPPMANP